MVWNCKNSEVEIRLAKDPTNDLKSFTHRCLPLLWCLSLHRLLYLSSKSNIIAATNSSSAIFFLHRCDSHCALVSLKCDHPWAHACAYLTSVHQGSEIRLLLCSWAPLSPITINNWFFFIPITCLLDFFFETVRRNSVLVTHGS